MIDQRESRLLRDVLGMHTDIEEVRATVVLNVVLPRQAKLVAVAVGALDRHRTIVIAVVTTLGRSPVSTVVSWNALKSSGFCPREEDGQGCQSE